MAFEWYRKAAVGNNATAMASLAAAYYFGAGTDQNYVLARRWLLKSAQASPSVLSDKLLGEIYFKGLGTKKDYKAALRWWRKLQKYDAVVGDGGAAFSIGLIYAYGGYGVKQNWDAAVRWWRKAAKMNAPAAMFNLGVAYQDGDGVNRSAAAAADWYYKAGVAFLAANDRDGALQALQRIKFLQKQHGAALPNGFLADKLLAAIYGGNDSLSAKSQAPAKRHQTITEGTGWPVVGGFLVTNHHVIAGADSIWVILPDGTKMSATIAADDVHNDLTLLKVRKPALLPMALPLATDAANTGERVFTLGYPHPGLMGKSAKLTDGIISSVTGLGDDPRLYQISVPLQAGNSGGPLINMNGAVVGVTEEKLDAAKVFQWTGDLPQNVNYAIKASYLAALMQSVRPVRQGHVLPATHASLEELDRRVAPSILMILAK